ncbi:MAG: hypothetical protein KAR20_04445, partial [Candidatus Heimdallarchaeota archaeon]|nr:hypothetical protein [Candidatus Heimdallarchaeota archaeon]
IYELAALDLLAHDEQISIIEWFDKELRKIVQHDPDCLECSTLISHKQIKQKREQEETKLKSQIETSLNAQLETHPLTEKIVDGLRLTSKATGSFDLDEYLESLNHYITSLPSYKILKASVEQTDFIPEDIILDTLDFVDDQAMKEESLLWEGENDNYKQATERLMRFKTETKDIIRFADPGEQRKKVEEQKLDLNLKFSESDEELAEAILNVLDAHDKQDSQHTIIAVLNNDPNKQRRLYVGHQGQFGRIIKQLTKEGKITYLPVKVGERERGYYKSKIQIPELRPIIERPEFNNRQSRTDWELDQYQTKVEVKKALIKEAARLFQSKNPDTGKFWRLDEIGKVLGGYSPTPVFNWLRKAGVDTRSVRLK